MSANDKHEKMQKKCICFHISTITSCFKPNIFECCVSYREVSHCCTSAVEHAACLACRNAACNCCRFGSWAPPNLQSFAIATADRRIAFRQFPESSERDVVVGRSTRVCAPAPPGSGAWPGLSAAAAAACLMPVSLPSRFGGPSELYLCDCHLCRYISGAVATSPAPPARSHACLPLTGRRSTPRCVVIPAGFPARLASRVPQSHRPRFSSPTSLCSLVHRPVTPQQSASKRVGRKHSTDSCSIIPHHK